MTGRERILSLLESTNKFALTDDEIAEYLGMVPSSARTRRCELERMGMVMPVGLTHTKAGRTTFLWAATSSVKDGSIRKKRGRK